MFSAKMRYASMFMLDLAKFSCGNHAKFGNVTRVSDTSCSSLAPKSYYESIISNLRKNKLILSIKGRFGGYVLAKDPSEVSVADIAKAVYGRVEIQKCSHSLCRMNKHGACDVSSFFEQMDEWIDEYMKHISLKDLLNKEGKNWVYADCNASAPSSSKAKATFLYASDLINPSSPGKLGQLAKSLLEQARRDVAFALEADGYMVVFTNSGTAANNLVLKGLPGFINVVSAIEHPSVNGSANAAHKVGVLDNGVIDLESLRSILDKLQGSNVLVSIMTANNETGVIQPVDEIAKICRSKNALFHTDAVQACGKIMLNVGSFKPDFVTISAHKFGSISGTGVILIKHGLKLKPLMHGGSQEYGVSPGTENIASIYSCSTVMKDLPKLLDQMKAVETLRNYMESSIKALGDRVVIIGESVERLPNTSLVCIPGLESSRQIAFFDANNISVGNGAACSYGKSEFSDVLRAMNVPDELAKSAIRISLGHETSKEDVDKIIRCWKDMYSRSFE